MWMGKERLKDHLQSQQLSRATISAKSHWNTFRDILFFRCSFFPIHHLKTMLFTIENISDTSCRSLCLFSSLWTLLVRGEGSRYNVTQVLAMDFYSSPFKPTSLLRFFGLATVISGWTCTTHGVTQKSLGAWVLRESPVTIGTRLGMPWGRPLRIKKRGRPRLWNWCSQGNWEILLEGMPWNYP